MAGKAVIDELIAQERAKLKRLKEEWNEKLRKAEIDISLERAKLARERTELEEQMQSLSQFEKDRESNSGASTEKGRRSRWLVRLGLAEDENEED